MPDVFDDVTVGGGTAGKYQSALYTTTRTRKIKHWIPGHVLASRLSAGIPDSSILLIEAGPGQGYFTGINDNFEWYYMSVPQQGLGGKVVTQWQGKAVGGFPAINVQG
jgi:hypothetical protein